MKRIQLVQIDAEAFAPFGVVLAPHADGVRRDHFELLVNQRVGARANLASVRADCRDGHGMTVRTLERHPDSSQTFFPLSVRKYLIVVCGTTADGWPDAARLLAFSVPGNVGIHYFPSTWHLGIGVLEGDGDFLMVVHEDGTHRDCEFWDIEPVEIAFD